MLWRIMLILFPARACYMISAYLTVWSTCMYFNFSLRKHLFSLQLNATWKVHIKAVVSLQGKTKTECCGWRTKIFTWTLCVWYNVCRQRWKNKKTGRYSSNLRLHRKAVRVLAKFCFFFVSWDTCQWSKSLFKTVSFVLLREISPFRSIVAR